MNVKIQIEICCDNAAFKGEGIHNEVVRILRQCVSDVLIPPLGESRRIRLRDIHGYKVGLATCKSED